MPSFSCALGELLWRRGKETLNTKALRSPLYHLEGSNGVLFGKRPGCFSNRRSASSTRVLQPHLAHFARLSLRLGNCERNRPHAPDLPLRCVGRIAFCLHSVISVPFLYIEAALRRGWAIPQRGDRSEIHFAGSIAVMLITSPFSVPVTFTFCPANVEGFF